MRFLILVLVVMFSFSVVADPETPISVKKITYEQWNKFCSGSDERYLQRACVKADQLCEVGGHTSETCYRARRDAMSDAAFLSISKS
jgi:hypothetical protein